MQKRNLDSQKQAAEKKNKNCILTPIINWEWALRLRSHRASHLPRAALRFFVGRCRRIGANVCQAKNKHLKIIPTQCQLPQNSPSTLHKESDYGFTWQPRFCIFFYPILKCLSFNLYCGSDHVISPLQ